jgi:hypothetical protein
MLLPREAERRKRQRRALFTFVATILSQVMAALGAVVFIFFVLKLDTMLLGTIMFGVLALSSAFVVYLVRPLTDSLGYTRFFLAFAIISGVFSVLLALGFVLQIGR